MPKPRHYICPVIGQFLPKGNSKAKVSPREFLSWAMKDLKSNDKRGRGNALSNIKKALHARLDEIIDRTHLRFSNDWNPRNVTTNKKLEVVRKIGIKHDAIVDLITKIRNDYEHGYIVPQLTIVRAHLETCELWLGNSYDNYDFQPVAMAGLPLIGISSGTPKANGSDIKSTKFDVPTKIEFFWNSKKKLVTIHPNGKVYERMFKEMTAKQMLQVEAPLIKKYCTSDSRSAFNQASLTDLFNRYKRWLGTVQ
jgi:hypothetical protein